MGRIRLEEDRVESRPLLAALAVVLAVGLLLSLWATRLGVRATVPAQPPTAAPATIAGVRQGLVGTERPGVRDREEARAALSRWRWIDEANGIVAMPIEEAMRLEAEGAR